MLLKVSKLTGGIRMSFLGYNKGETLEFNYKKACGLWLIAVAFVIALATVVGGEQIINMQVFSIGYMICTPFTGQTSKGGIYYALLI